MVVVEDFNGATLSTFSGFTGGKVDMKELMDNIQENVPMRVRLIILLDAPWYVRLLVAFVKPFLKKRMRKKVHLLSTFLFRSYFLVSFFQIKTYKKPIQILSISTSELPKYIPKENILREYGGTLDFDYEAWTKDMLENRGYLSDGKYFNLEGAEIHRTGWGHKEGTEQEVTTGASDQTDGKQKKKKGSQ